MDPAQVFSDTSGNQGGFNPPTDSGPKEGGAPKPQVDPEALKQTLTHFQGQNAELTKDLQALKESHIADSKLMDGLKNLFNPKEQDPNMTAKEQDEALLDMVLDAAMRSRDAGTGGMPITVQLAGQLVQQKELARQLQSKINELTGKVDRFANPDYERENRAYFSMDSMAQNMIENVYGQPQPHILNGVAQGMVQSAKAMQAQAPDKWAAIIRTPALQQRFVQHHVEQLIPQKAKDLLHQQKLQSEDMPASEILQAMQELKQAYEAGKVTPEDYSKIKREMRQKFWEEQHKSASGRLRV